MDSLSHLVLSYENQKNEKYPKKKINAEQITLKNHCKQLLTINYLQTSDTLLCSRICEAAKYHDHNTEKTYP